MSRKVRSGSAAIAGTEDGDDARRDSDQAAATPSRADRQLRVAPAASTMVAASTDSTRQARKTASEQCATAHRAVAHVRVIARPARRTTRRRRPSEYQANGRSVPVRK